MKIRTLAFATTMATGALALSIATNDLHAEDIEPGLTAADIGSTTILSPTWLETRAGDFSAAKLIADPGAIPPSAHRESATVQFAWPMSEAPASSFEVPRVDSRQYWVDASGDDLAKGVRLPLTAPGAVIRISPLNADAKVRIASSALSLSIANESIGEQALDSDALAHLADGASLKAAGMDVPESTLAFELADTVPAGWLKLGVDALPADIPMVIHVFEPNSPWRGQLTLPARDFFTGAALSLGFGIGDGKAQVPVSTVQALITNPTARRQFELTLDPVTGTLSGELPKDLEVSGQAGLFEAHAYLETTTPDGLVVRRDLKIPFSVALPVARLDGSAKASLGDALTIEIGIESAAHGRFQINGQVFGTAADGSLQPLALAQVAGSVSPGHGALQLKVERSVVEASGLSAPFEVRGLELFDQGRMFRLQRQQQALRLTR